MSSLLVFQPACFPVLFSSVAAGQKTWQFSPAGAEEFSLGRKKV
jgi:hypothetical protein